MNLLIRKFMRFVPKLLYLVKLPFTIVYTKSGIQCKFMFRVTFKHIAAMEPELNHPWREQKRMYCLKRKSF